jgi:hypothetical protein
MNRPDEIKFSSPSDRHAKMIAELNRLIGIIFDEPEKQGQSTKQEAKI